MPISGCKRLRRIGESEESASMLIHSNMRPFPQGVQCVQDGHQRQGQVGRQDGCAAEERARVQPGGACQPEPSQRRRHSRALRSLQIGTCAGLFCVCIGLLLIAALSAAGCALGGSSYVLDCGARVHTCQPGWRMAHDAHAFAHAAVQGGAGEALHRQDVR